MRRGPRLMLILFLCASNTLFLLWWFRAGMVVVVVSSACETGAEQKAPESSEQRRQDGALGSKSSTPTETHPRMRHIRRPAGKKNTPGSNSTKDGKEHPGDPEQRPPRHGGIPHILWFTSRENILESKKPKYVYNNIRNTISSYETAVRNTTANEGVTVRFLVDSDCRELIARAEPELAPHFDAEKSGPYKADICRVAALYLHGGYYFDVDMRVVEPILFTDADETAFATALEMPSRDQFFQSFLASAKRHPILREALAVMLEYYTAGEWQFRQNLLERDNMEFQYMGTTTLYLAYKRVSDDDRKDSVLFQESNLDDGMFPDLPRQRGNGCCCNYVVHDGTKAYFFSRIPGYSEYCQPISSN